MAQQSAGAVKVTKAFALKYDECMARALNHKDRDVQGQHTSMTDRTPYEHEV